MKLHIDLALFSPFITSYHDHANIKQPVYTKGLFLLTHLPLVPQIYVSEMGQHWFK